MAGNRKSKGKPRGSVVGRDQHLVAGEGGVVIGGDVSGSTIVAGSRRVVHAPTDFTVIYRMVDERPDLPAADKADLKTELAQIEAEARKEQPDEGFLERRLRNVRRIAPDILDVALATLGNPLAGFGMVVKKVAQKIAQEASE